MLLSTESLQKTGSIAANGLIAIMHPIHRLSELAEIWLAGAVLAS